MLNANDLYKERNEIKNKSKQIYKDLLDKCYKKIRNANLNKQTKIIFRLQVIHLDKPLYDLNYAQEYIIRRLKKGNFRVHPISQCKIFIDWSQNT